MKDDCQEFARECAERLEEAAAIISGLLEPQRRRHLSKSAQLKFEVTLATLKASAFGFRVVELGTGSRGVEA